MRFSEQIAAAKAVRESRGKVEDVFLHQRLWSGSVTANFVALDGNITTVESHTWGSEEGKHIFERGWIEPDKGGGWTTVCSVLIKESDLEDPISSAPAANQRTNVVTDDENTSAAPRFSRAEVSVWYESYVERLSSNGEKSSRDDDLSAAHKHFGIKIQRDFMRDLRRELAPEEWTAKGAPRRKS